MVKFLPMLSAMTGLRFVKHTNLLINLSLILLFNQHAFLFIAQEYFIYSSIK